MRNFKRQFLTNENEIDHCDWTVIRPTQRDVDTARRELEAASRSTVEASKSTVEAHNAPTDTGPNVAGPREPTTRQLIDLSMKICDSWKFVARRLELDKKVIDMINKNYSPDTRECAYQMLETWKEEKDQDATVEVLCKALLDERLKTTAKDIFKTP